MEEIKSLLPQGVRLAVEKLPAKIQSRIEEIRLRVGRVVELIADGRSIYLEHNAAFSAQDAQTLMSRLSEYSLYTLEEELRRGYVTVQGGHRVGLAGKVITDDGKVKLIRDIGSFNIRIAHQKIGAARSIATRLFQNQRWHNTLFIGPPQTGKTTLLRDLARIASLGEGAIPAKKVAIVDERSEIAGCVKGVPQNDFGPRIDVLDACPKAEGMMMMIRSMSPDLLIVDEIGRAEDTDALLEALNAGVSVVASAHGYKYEQLLKRPTIRPLLDHHVFDRFVILSRRQGPGRVETILNAEGKPVQLLKELRY